MRRPFHVELASRLAYLSAELYGRDALDVELDLQAALQRIRGPQAPVRDTEQPTPDESTPLSTRGGEPSPGGIVSGNEVPPS